MSTTVYGAYSDLETVRQAVETCLGIQFELRNSSYRGGDYYKYGKVGQDEEYAIQNNYVPYLNAYSVSKRQDCVVLLYFTCDLQKAESIHHKIMAESAFIPIYRDISHAELNVQRLDWNGTSFVQAG